MRLNNVPIERPRSYRRVGHEENPPWSKQWRTCLRRSRHTSGPFAPGCCRSRRVRFLRQLRLPWLLRMLLRIQLCSNDGSKVSSRCSVWRRRGGTSRRPRQRGRARQCWRSRHGKRAWQRLRRAWCEWCPGGTSHDHTRMHVAVWSCGRMCNVSRRVAHLASVVSDVMQTVVDEVLHSV